jgi:D-aminopeptidase
MTHSANGQGCTAVLVEDKNSDGRSLAAKKLSDNYKLRITGHLKHFVSATGGK